MSKVDSLSWKHCSYNNDATLIFSIKKVKNISLVYKKHKSIQYCLHNYSYNSAMKH